MELHLKLLGAAQTCSTWLGLTVAVRSCSGIARGWLGLLGQVPTMRFLAGTSFPQTNATCKKPNSPTSKTLHEQTRNGLWARVLARRPPPCQLQYKHLAQPRVEPVFCSSRHAAARYERAFQSRGVMDHADAFGRRVFCNEPDPRGLLSRCAEPATQVRSA